MSPTRCAFAILALSACGPSATQASKFKVLSAGTGDAVVKGLDTTPGTRFTMAITSNPAPLVTPPAVETAYAPGFTLDNGAHVEVFVTETQDLYLETNADGQFLWGAHDTGVLEAPLLQIRLPLQQGTSWETGDQATPGWYRYDTEAIEPLDTPAGTFTTARVLQTNTKTGEVVTRWYADQVGLVKRHGNGLDTVLLRVVLAGGVR